MLSKLSSRLYAEFLPGAQSVHLEQTSIDLRVLAHHFGMRKLGFDPRGGLLAEGRGLLRVVQEQAYLTR